MYETSIVDAVVLLLLALGWLVFRVRDWLEEDVDDVEEARRAYVADEIDEQELERRLALHLDERNERIREHVEHVNGVGPSTSAAVAVEFESVDRLRRASRDELESVAGVGPKTAEAIRDRFS